MPFRDHAKQHTSTLDRVSEDEVKSKSDQVDYLLMCLEHRLIELPSGIDVVEFVSFDGKRPADVQEVPAESRGPTLTRHEKPVSGRIRKTKGRRKGFEFYINVNKSYA